jgi:hypothetical protein
MAVGAARAAEDDGVGETRRQRGVLPGSGERRSGEDGESEGDEGELAHGRQ